MKKALELSVLLLAAVFEVGGDALIRAGLRGEATWLIALGFAILGSYGLVLNQLQLDFAKLLGGYVAVFAVVSVLFGTLPRAGVHYYVARAFNRDYRRRGDAVGLKPKVCPRH